MPWILYLAERSPLLEVGEPRITALGGGRHRIEVDVTNSGFLPTSLTDRGVVGAEAPDGSLTRQVVRPPAVTLESRGLEIVEGPVRQALEHLAGSNSILVETEDRTRTVSWTVGTVGDEPAFRVVARSDKGGTARSGWVELER